jgi:hypothetical protein
LWLGDIVQPITTLWLGAMPRHHKSEDLVNAAGSSFCAIGTAVITIA